MELFALTTLPQIDPLLAKLAVFGLAILSVITGTIAYYRLKASYQEDKEISRKRYHIFINVITVLGCVYLIGLGESTTHAGWIALMFALAAFISGIFTYRSMQVQMERGDEKLDRPDIHAIAGTFLVLYTAYMSLWDPISSATGIGDAIFAGIILF